MKQISKLLFLLVISLFIFSCNQNEKIGEYTVSYDLDGGSVDSNLITTFKTKDNIELPNAKKEGYIFVGWFDGEVFTEKLESKDYSLKAIFIEPFEYEIINEDMLFNQEYCEYFIYIYRDGCAWCSKIKEDVQKYIYKTSLDSYKSSIKVFVINLTKDGKKSKIFRTYDGDDYDEGYEGFFVSKATKYDEIYIPSTPALLKVTASNEKVQATCLAKGASIVVSEMNKGLKVGSEELEKRPHYTITYDLNDGIANGELITTFYSWSKIKLPTITKEGYIFIGWYENDDLVIKLENRDYNLVAHFEKLKEPDIIKAYDIFSIDRDKYYVFFVNKDAEIYSDIVDVVSRFNIINKYGIKVYFVDILDNDTKPIKRSYFGDDGQSNTGRFYVDGVETWSELYIPKAPGLIEISIFNGKKVSKYLSDGDDCFDFLENILSE